MSRFSKSEAKGLGWSFTDTHHGILASKVLQASGFPVTTVNEFGETTGLCLERVFAYEAHLRKLGYYKVEPSGIASIEGLLDEMGILDRVKESLANGNPPADA